jgi:hypothetical protein
MNASWQRARALTPSASGASRGGGKNATEAGDGGRSLAAATRAAAGQLLLVDGLRVGEVEE